MRAHSMVHSVLMLLLLPAATPRSVEVMLREAVELEISPETMWGCLITDYPHADTNPCKFSTNSVVKGTLPAHFTRAGEGEHCGPNTQNPLKRPNVCVSSQSKPLACIKGRCKQANKGGMPEMENPASIVQFSEDKYQFLGVPSEGTAQDNVYVKLLRRTVVDSHGQVFNGCDRRGTDTPINHGASANAGKIGQKLGMQGSCTKWSDFDIIHVPSGAGLSYRLNSDQIESVDFKMDRMQCNSHVKNGDFLNFDRMNSYHADDDVIGAIEIVATHASGDVPDWNMTKFTHNGGTSVHDSTSEVTPVDLGLGPNVWCGLPQPKIHQKCYDKDTSAWHNQCALKKGGYFNVMACKSKDTYAVLGFLALGKNTCYGNHKHVQEAAYWQLAGWGKWKKWKQPAGMGNYFVETIPGRHMWSRTKVDPEKGETPNKMCHYFPHGVEHEMHTINNAHVPGDEDDFMLMAYYWGKRLDNPKLDLTDVDSQFGTHQCTKNVEPMNEGSCIEESMYTWDPTQNKLNNQTGTFDNPTCPGGAGVSRGTEAANKVVDNIVPDHAPEEGGSTLNHIKDTDP